jgi:hypothetical protein
MNGQRRYAARAKTWGLGETSKGTEQIAVEFEILTEEAEFNHITWFGYFSDKTFERTIESLRHCGWTGHDLTDLTGLDANEVELVIEDEDDEDGNPRARVRWVNRKGGLALKAPLTGDKAKTFAASMRDKIKALDASAGRPTQAKPVATAKRPPVGAHGIQTPPPLTDDDLLI